MSRKPKTRKVRIENTFHNTQAVLLVPADWVEDFEDDRQRNLDPWSRLCAEVPNPKCPTSLKRKFNRAVDKLCGISGCHCARFDSYAGPVRKEKVHQ